MSSSRQLAAILFTDIVGYSQMPEYELATLSIGLGNNNNAMQHLEQAYKNHEPWMPFIDMNPLFIPLKGNPEFMALVKRIETRG